MLDILQSFLAFAATMLVLATLVTLIIEIVARIFRRRYRIFTHLLRQLFKKELQPLIESSIKTQLGEDPDKVAAEIESRIDIFLDEIRNSPLEPVKDKNPLTWFGGWLRWFGADRSEKLTTEEFIRRLARSRTGREIYKQTAGRVNRLIDSLCLRYQELSEAMSEYIKNSSSILSMTIGIILAFTINLEAYRLFNFYIENPDIAQNVADNAAAYADAYMEAQQRLDDALAALDRPETGQVESIAEARKEIEAIRDRLESAPANVFALTAEGIPIGLNYFPFCRFRDTITTDGEVAYPCKDVEARYRLFSPQAPATDLWPDYLLWIIKVIITGVLIGLGGPFWYDAVRGLARATQILRGRASPPKAPAGSLPGARTPSNPVDIFKRHVELDGTMPDREESYGGPRWRSPTET